MLMMLVMMMFPTCLPANQRSISRICRNTPTLQASSLSTTSLHTASRAVRVVAAPILTPSSSTHTWRVQVEVEVQEEEEVEVPPHLSQLRHRCGAEVDGVGAVLECHLHTHLCVPHHYLQVEVGVEVEDEVDDTVEDEVDARVDAGHLGTGVGVAEGQQVGQGGGAVPGGQGAGKLTGGGEPGVAGVQGVTMYQVYQVDQVDQV